MREQQQQRNGRGVGRGGARGTETRAPCAGEGSGAFKGGDALRRASRAVVQARRAAFAFAVHHKTPPSKALSKRPPRHRVRAPTPKGLLPHQLVDVRTTDTTPRWQRNSLPRCCCAHLRHRTPTCARLGTHGTPLRVTTVGHAAPTRTPPAAGAVRRFQTPCAALTIFPHAPLARCA